MRVAMLAAGAGGMYCGSCLRDNRLAATLIAKGRDVVLIPLYTPIRTDEFDVSHNTVFYGGINVYLRQKWTWFRRLPAWLARTLDSPRLLRKVQRLAGTSRPQDLGAMTVSVLQGPSGLYRPEFDRLVGALRSMAPDLICLPNLMFVGLAATLKEALRVPVLCTLSGEDVFIDQLAEPHRGAAMRLVMDGAGRVDGFIAVSHHYARHAALHFCLLTERITVVPLGVYVDDVDGPADSPSPPFTIGYLARICPEKGLEALCEAFVRLCRAGRDCRLRVAGYLGPHDRPYLARIRERLHGAAPGGSFEFVGEVDRAGKQAFLRSLHVLSVPTVAAEAKGLYVLEAMARGVPVVQPRHGSFPELVDATGGGVLYDPEGGAASLGEAIAALMDDEPRRRRLAENGRRAVRESFSAEVMADRTWAVFERYCDRA